MSNNINSRIKQTENNIKTNISRLNKIQNSNKSIGDKLQGYTTNFKNFISGSLSSNTKNNKSQNNINSNKNLNQEESPFDNPIILFSIFIIAIGFIVYGIYKFYKSESAILSGNTYYGKDLVNYKPLFKENTKNIEECVNRCNIDTSCNGITYNDELNECVGTKDGVVRSDTINYKAWVKPDKEDVNINNTKIMGYAESIKTIKGHELAFPRIPNEYNYSFYIFLNDFYKNHGSWKHIFHKGSTIPIDTVIETPNWSDIEKDYPIQTIGVWMAPFNNNIRIAISTEHLIELDERNVPIHKSEYNHAYKQEIILNKDNSYSTFISDKPNGEFADTTRLLYKQKNILDGVNGRIENKLEYIDIYHIPVGNIHHISVNVVGTTLEVYINGKLNKIQRLIGNPIYKSGDLFAMNNKTINGALIDLKYVSKSLIPSEVNKLISNKSDLELKTMKKIKVQLG